MIQRVTLEDLLGEVHQIMRERGMDSWLEAELIKIVMDASRRLNEREARRDNDRHVRPGPQLEGGRR